MTPKKKKDQGVHSRAILVNVKIHFWRARKHDRVVTEETTDKHGADRDAGRFHKRLFGGKVKEMTTLSTARSRLRDVHRHQTLPWTDEGWRILPTENYFQYTELIRQHITAFNEATEEFVAAYPRLREEAKVRLTTMYNVDDYPSAESVRAKYGVEVEYAPLPSGSDFRVDLPEGELKSAAAEVEARVAATVETAMADAWGRLLESVSRLRERLDGDGKGLREAAVRNMQETADVLTRINLTGDKKLEKLSARALKELGDLDAAELRGDDKLRAEAKAKADKIFADVSAAFGGGS